MLKNKKKLRRLERNTPGYAVKTAQSLVLAGALVLGGAAVASAAVTWGADQDVVISATESFTTTQQAKSLTIQSGGELKNPGNTSGHIFVSGATVLNAGGNITLGGGNTGHGIMGVADGAAEAAGTFTGAFTMNGGDLTIGTGAAAGSMLQMNTVHIKGGTVNMQGRVPSGANWTDGSMLVGGLGTAPSAPASGLAISGGTINMGNSAQIVVATGTSMDITGGIINMDGAADNESILRASASNAAADTDTTHATLNIGGTAQINVAATKAGVILSRETHMTGGKLDVKGMLTVAGAANSSAKIIDAIDGAAKKWGAFNVSGGEVNVAGKLRFADAMGLTIGGNGLVSTTDTGRIYAEGATVLNNGGTLNLHSAGGMIGDKDDAFTSAKGTFTMNGGTLNVGKGVSDSSVANGNNGSMLQMDKVSIKGGVVNLQGRVGDNNNWTSGSMIVGGVGTTNTAGSYFSVSGGTINMGDYAQLVVGSVSGQSSMDISNGTIHLNGSTANNAAIIRASSTNAQDASADTHAKLNVSGGLISVAADKHGVILSRETDMTGGTLDVQGTLTVAGAASGASGQNIQAGINGASKKWGDFNLKGGTINVTGAGKLDLTTGGVALTVSGGTLNTTNLVIAGASTIGGTSITNGTFVKQSLSASNTTVQPTITGGHVVVNNSLYASSSGNAAIEVKGTGVLSINKGNIATTGGTVAANGITLGTSNNGGALVIKGFEGVAVTAAELADYGYSNKVFTSVANSNLDLTQYDGNNVILQGAVLANVDKNITGNSTAAAPETLNVTKQSGAAAAIGTNGVVTAPSLTAEGGALTSAGKLVLDAAVANKGVSTSTTLTSFESKTGAVTTVSNGASLNLGTYTHTAGSTTVANGAVLNVSATEITAGTLDVLHSEANLGTLKASGGTIFVDPAYVTIDGVDGTFGGQLLNGLGGVVNVGSQDKVWINEAISRSGAAADASVLALKSGIDLGASGQILVDKGVTKKADGTYEIGGTAVARNAQGALNFGDNSLLVVDAKAFSGTDAALKVSGSNNTLITSNTVTGTQTASKLHIYGGRGNDTVKIVSGATGITGILADNKGWTADQISFSSALVGLDSIIITGGNIYDVKLKGVSSLNTFHRLSPSMGGLVDSMYAQVGIDVDNSNAGVRFVSRAVDDRFIGRNDAEKAAATIEGAAQMGAVAGVQISTIGAASVASGAVTTRTSFAQPLMDMTKAVAVHQDNDGTLSLDTGLNAGNGMKNGLGVWIMPLYQSNNTWGQKAENFKSGMSSDLGGIALGADYTINDMFRFGAAFNVGGGYAQSSGDFNETENRFNFWGVNLYGGWTMNNFGLSADVGYTSSFNAVEQDTPAAMAMGNLKADVTTSAWTAGLKGEYKFETSVVDIIPHVGVRYMGLTTDSYDVKSGGTVFGVEQDFQSIWTFPIGVAFSKTITSDSGWMFKPMVDLTVIPAAGDLEAKSKASIPGVGGQAEMKMQVVDYVTFDGGLGFEVGKDNLSFGLNYNIQASEHRTGHGVFGTLRYEF